MPQPLTRVVEFTLSAGGFLRRCPAVLSFDPEIPWVVRADFPRRMSADGRTAVRWAFSRELLSAGLDGPSGEGDVRVYPLGVDEVAIELRVRRDEAQLVCGRAVLAAFLAETCLLVPFGEESCEVDWDALAASWAAADDPLRGEDR